MWYSVIFRILKCKLFGIKQNELDVTLLSESLDSELRMNTFKLISVMLKDQKLNCSEQSAQIKEDIYVK